MTKSSAYLLVSHGSRDPRPQVACEVLAGFLSKRLGNLKKQSFETPLSSRDLEAVSESSAVVTVSHPSAQQTISPLSAPNVGTAVLELHPLPLHQQIQQFAEQAIAVGFEVLQIIPLFLLPGVHVMEDIPCQVEIARQLLQQKIEIQIQPYLGSHLRLPSLLMQRLEIPETTPKILISHGSRRPGANQPIEAIAAQLVALPAYWSMSPSLESQVTVLIQQGYEEIAILPYFLFAGGITDAIAQMVADLAHRFPKICFHLAEPLGASEELADLLVDLMQ